MSDKTFTMWGMFIGSVIGGYLPTLFGKDIFSISAILGSAAGGILGIIITRKIINS